MFEKPSDIAAIYPAFVLHGIQTFSSGNVLRFLGRKVHGNFEGQITSDFKDRDEGINRNLQSLLFDNSAKTPKSNVADRPESHACSECFVPINLIQKVPRTHRYMLTARGRDVLSAVLTAHRVTLEQLNKLAA